MFRTLSIMVHLFCTAQVFAESPKLPIAVLDLDASGVSSSAARTLTDRLRIELFTIGIFDIMNRDKMNDILHEQRFQQSGCTSTACIIAVGKMISVKGIVSGSVGKLGNKYLLTIHIIDVETGRIVATATEECTCPLESLTAAMDKVALKLTSAYRSKVFTFDGRDTGHNNGMGNFYIKTIPSGATMYINNKLVSTMVTPMTIEDIPVGRYKIRAEQGDFSKAVTVELGANEFKNVQLTLEKKVGILQVLTKQAGADVYLNDQSQGKTPFELHDLTVGSYMLKISRAGHLDVMQEIEIKELEKMELEFVLQKPGPLKVLSEPLEAEVFIDDEKRGVTPVIITGLTPGKHQLALRKEGYHNYSDEIVINSAEELKLEPTLVSQDGSKLHKHKTQKIQKPGGTIDSVFKWITIGGGLVFVGVLVLAAVQ